MISRTMHVQADAQTHHEPEVLFNILTDCERAPTRFRWIRRLEKQTPGPAHVGTELNQDISILGIRKRFLLTIEKFEPPYLYCLRCTDGRQAGRQEIRLRERKEGTDITLRSESTLGLGELLLWPIVKKSAILFCEDFIEDLIAAADSEEPRTGSATVVLNPI